MNQLSIDATVTDDGQPAPLIYAWSVVSGPAGVTFSDQTSEDTGVTFTSSGTYVIRLSASDSLLIGTDDVTINVRLNAPPVVHVATAPAIQFPANSGPVSGTGDDADGPNPLIFSWTVISGPGTVVFSDPNSADSTATFGAPGQYVLRLTADDGIDSSFEDMIVNVAAAPAPAPSLNLLGDTVFNPKNGPLTIPVSVSSDGNVRIRVFDILGREVIEVTDGFQAAGDHSFTWDGRNDEQSEMGAAIYILFIELPGSTSKKKIALLK